MRYNEVIDTLQYSINQKGLTSVFKQSIENLKINFNVKVSTKFLRGLSDLKDISKQSQRISYLMRGAGLKTEKAYRIYEIRGVNKYRTDVVTWGHDKTIKPFPEVVGLTDDEKRQISEIKAIKEEMGISLFNHSEANLNGRQKTQDAFNYGGGAVVRRSRVADIGDYKIMERQEILYMVC